MAIVWGSISLCATPAASAHHHHYIIIIIVIIIIWSTKQHTYFYCRCHPLSSYEMCADDDDDDDKDRERRRHHLIAHRMIIITLSTSHLLRILHHTLCVLGSFLPIL